MCFITSMKNHLVQLKTFIRNKIVSGRRARLRLSAFLPEPGYCYTIEHGGYKIVAAPRAVYIDGIWNQEDADKWLTIIQAPVEKA